MQAVMILKLSTTCVHSAVDQNSSVGSGDLIDRFR